MKNRLQKRENLSGWDPTLLPEEEEYLSRRSPVVFTKEGIEMMGVL